MENDTLSPCDPANLFLKLAQPCDKPHWKHVRRIKGKGSAKFLKTLSRHHLNDGKSRVTRYRIDDWGHATDCKGYRYHRIVSHVAIAVWEDPEQRQQWLRYHKATSRLVPIS
jgi:poly(3-hydroxybutyrate) depolymerase